MHSRNIKIGFFRNENLGNCDPLARLLFVGMWCIADREGRMEDRPGRIAAEALPFDGVKPAEAERLVAQLAAERDPHDPTAPALIRRYRVGDKNYIQIVNFTKHQKPHHTEGASKLPPCEIPAQPNGEQTGSEQGDNGEQTGEDPLVSSLDSLDSQNPKYPPYSPPKGDGAGEQTTLVDPDAIPDRFDDFKAIFGRNKDHPTRNNWLDARKAWDVLLRRKVTGEQALLVTRYLLATDRGLQSDAYKPGPGPFLRKIDVAGLLPDALAWEAGGGGTQVTATAESEEKRQGRLAREKWEAEHGVPVWR